uniref:Glucosylceramidase n=1 Tax=Lepeophtheirus salmonis TaxID=72036 RepID=A0A0K2TER0_LEPSM
MKVRGKDGAEEEKDDEFFPSIGWRKQGDEVFPEKRNQNLRPRPKQFKDLLPLSIRYSSWILECRSKKLKPNIDSFSPWNSQRMYGVPCGGIGSGTIGRGFRGEFTRYQMIPGKYSHYTVNGDAFLLSLEDPKTGESIYQTILGPSPKKSVKKSLSSWDSKIRDKDITYHALYPRSWTSFTLKKMGLVIECEQVSPFVPQDYEDSSLPCVVFLWTVINESSQEYIVRIIHTKQSGIGREKKSSDHIGSYVQRYKNTIQLHQSVKHHHDLRLSYILSGRSSSKNDVVFDFHVFDPKGDGKDVFKPSKDIIQTPPVTSKGSEIGMGISFKIKVGGNDKCTGMRTMLGWDCPEIRFRQGSKLYKRWYTRTVGSERNVSGHNIAERALNKVDVWRKKIEEWQSPVLKDSGLPTWFKSAVFNEMYYLADGGSQWLELDEVEKKTMDPKDPRIQFGRFAYLEAHEYTLFNSYDVHFYASFALSSLFPGLQASLQADIIDATLNMDSSSSKDLYNGTKSQRNLSNVVPHDLGDPEEDPFCKVNSYMIHNISHWRDLPCKLVLSLWRDILAFENDFDGQYAELSQWLKEYAWEACQNVMNVASIKFDIDGDSLIENSGKPDQTYDSWTMTGKSAYCGGLWIAACAVMTEYAENINVSSEIRLKWEKTYNEALQVYEDKLWTGHFFAFDERSRDVIMCDQLCGQWYLSLMQGWRREVFNKNHIHTALETIFDYNVMKFRDGTSGAVNGMYYSSGNIDRSSIQSEEMWCGVSYALASLMIREGLVMNGFKTAKGVFETVYDRIGLGFETPEALYEKNHYRALGYMRPLSIWSMYEAWKQLRHQEEKHH